MEGFDYNNWILFPLLIFFARVCDVSLGTLRSVLAAKGHKKIVPFIGFFEVLIWLAAISQIFQNLNNNWLFYFAWAGGYATGSYIGLVLEEKIALGVQVVRIITNQSCEKLISALDREKYGLTIVDAQGARGPVKILFTTVKRINVGKVIDLINEYNPNAFFSVEDVKSASQIYIPALDKKVSFFRRILPVRK
ncbi:MAG: DUF2179 domain-containing protein [Bacteroidetes bacterium]|nr:DUF2179 domain-containing protein [Bacteroidota bacterium]HET6244352.1 DUF2179 domain-containing protein [Bacteroidia bacterium]